MCRKVSEISHSELYHQLEDQIPESVFAQSFFVRNYLEFKLDHEDVMLSSDKKVEFPF